MLGAYPTWTEEAQSAFKNQFATWITNIVDTTWQADAIRTSEHLVKHLSKSKIWSHLHSWYRKKTEQDEKRSKFIKDLWLCTVYLLTWVLPCLNSHNNWWSKAIILILRREELGIRRWKNTTKVTLLVNNTDANMPANFVLALCSFPRLQHVYISTHFIFFTVVYWKLCSREWRVVLQKGKCDYPKVYKWTWKTYFKKQL